MSEAPNLFAGGDIRPARFVKLSTTANHTVLESDAGDVSIGISHEDTKEAPQAGASTNHAEDGDNVRIHLPGEVCRLKADATGWTAGDLLKSDADGQGDVAVATDVACAMALETTAAGEFGEVLVISPHTV